MNTWLAFALGVVAAGIGIAVVIYIKQNPTAIPMSTGVGVGVGGTYVPANTLSVERGYQNEASYEVERDEEGRIKRYIVHRRVVPIVGDRRN